MTTNIGTAQSVTWPIDCKAYVLIMVQHVPSVIVEITGQSHEDPKHLPQKDPAQITVTTRRQNYNNQPYNLRGGTLTTLEDLQPLPGRSTPFWSTQLTRWRASL